MLKSYTLANGATVCFYDSDFDHTVYFGGHGYKHSKAYDFWFDCETRREVTDESILQSAKLRCVDGNANCYKNLTPNVECSEEEKKRTALTKYIIKSTKDSIDQFIDVPTMENLLEVKAMLESLDKFGVKYDYSFKGSIMALSAAKSWNWREIMEIIKNMKFTNMEKKEEPEALNSYASYIISNTPLYTPIIKKIIVNDKTTIVLWVDGTKTIVRPSANDNYDLEAAVCAAIAKKIYGTNSAFKRMIREKTVVQENKKNKENNQFLKTLRDFLNCTKPRDVENDGFVSTKGEEG